MEPPHYLVFVCAATFEMEEEPEVLEIAASLANVDRCIVHTWLRTDHENLEKLPRVQPVRRKFFYGQTAAFMLGQAYEAVCGDVPSTWRGSPVVFLVAPPGVFRDRVMAAISELFVTTLSPVQTVDSFREVAVALRGE
jgi:hypothetical protein